MRDHAWNKKMEEEKIGLVFVECLLWVRPRAKLTVIGGGGGTQTMFSDSKSFNLSLYHSAWPTPCHLQGQLWFTQEETGDIEGTLLFWTLLRILFYLSGYLVSDFYMRGIMLAKFLKTGISLVLRNIISTSYSWWLLGWKISWWILHSGVNSSVADRI